jgi:hypothetical protein
MGRMELVQKIVAENPHLAPGEVDAIVATVIAEMAERPQPERDSLNQNDDDIHVEGLDPEDAAKAMQFLRRASNLSDAAFEDSLNSLNQDDVRAVFETMFASIQQTAATMKQMGRDSERFHEEFVQRAGEIDALQADIDARLERLVGRQHA